MKIVHSIHGRELSAESNALGCLLTSKRGGFFMSGIENNFSKYNGCHIAIPLGDSFEMFKTVEEIRLNGPNVTEVRNNFSNIEKVRDDCRERLYMTRDDVILYEVEGFHGHGELVLDCRKMYDFSDKGRIYEYESIDGYKVIKYTKYADDKLEEVDYVIYTVIAGLGEHRKIDLWEPREYYFDSARENKECRLYVYKALGFKVDSGLRLVIASSDDLNKALDAAKHAEKHYDTLKMSLARHAESITSGDLMTDGRESMVYRCCQYALDSYLCRIPGTKSGTEGIYAGLPWFHQFWTRDEAICLGGLIRMHRFSDVKKILKRQLSLMLPDGRISNRWPGSDLGSADGVGWCFRRMHEFFEELEKTGRFEEYITKDDFVWFKTKLRHSIINLLNHHTIHGLEKNDALETWMDTSEGIGGTDTREGFRIEIQALRLAMYRLMRYLCLITGNKKKYRMMQDLEEASLKKIRMVFWHKPELYDGSDDPTIRPNIFLAYYIYPNLLDNFSWKLCFENALKHLWLDWGGLSTIQKDHPLYCDSYSGQDNRSYHRGDSWFFVNNIAAIAMHRVDPVKFSSYIKKIADASSKDILENGIIGHGSELSSAKEQRAEASLAQAWSAATLLELLDEISS